MLWKALLLKLVLIIGLSWIGRRAVYGQNSFYLQQDSVLILVCDTNQQLRIQGFEGTLESLPIFYTLGDFSVSNYAAKLCFVNQTNTPIIYDKQPTIWNDCAFHCYPNAILTPGDSAWVNLNLYPGRKFHSTYAKKQKLFKRVGAFKFYTAELGIQAIPVRFLIHLSPLEKVK